jgi:hypothetical protein
VECEYKVEVLIACRGRVKGSKNVMTRLPALLTLSFDWTCVGWGGGYQSIVKLWKHGLDLYAQRECSMQVSN